jgi:ATP-dependent DNA helicase DinG
MLKEHPIKFFKKHDLEARNEQQYVLDKINSEWDKNTYFLLSLPPGVGKTYIACSVADAVGSAYILTSTLQLQNQYESSWKEIVNLKGRSNYSCNLNPEFNVDNAPCLYSPELKQECKNNKTCSYFNQRGKAMASRAMITNPAYMLLSKHGSADTEDDLWAKRPLMVIDEAHNLEKHLVSFAQSTINPRELFEEHGARTNNLKFSKDQEENYKILESILVKLQERVEEIYDKIEEEFPNTNNKGKQWAKGLSAKVADRVQKLNLKIYALNRSIQPLEIFFKSHANIADDLKIVEMSKKWVITPNLDDNTVQISPLYGNFLFDLYLKPLADKFIFQSATLGTKTQFCNEIGLPQNEALFIETDTPFPAEKSPIIIFPELKMGAKDLPITLNTIQNALERILDVHQGERGIIHCATYKLQEELYKRVSPEYRKRLLCRDMDVFEHIQQNKAGFAQKLSNEKLLNMHDARSDSVLVSPSMMEGVDLHDDLSSFQIILKMPWVSLGDPRTKKKSEIDPDWYTNAVWMQILQASGRSTRHIEDESVTYILDASFPYFYQKWKKNLPEWFNRRLYD